VKAESPGSPEEPHAAGSLGALFRNRDFTLLAASRFLSSTAMHMQSVAIGWQIYAQTGKVSYLGYVGLAQFLPFFIFILWSGQVADRHDRRKILIACNAAYLIGSLALLAYSLSGIPSVAPVFAILAVLGSARAFAMPASQAMIRNVVDDSQLGRALPVFTGIFHVAVVAGPMLGGFLYLTGPASTHATVSASLLAATAMLSLVRTRQKLEPPSPMTWHGTLEGFRFVRSKPILLGAMSLDLFAVLFGGVTAMLPAIAHDILHADASALGMLRAAPAVGAVFLSLILARHPLRRKVGAWMFTGVALFGVATIGVGLSGRLWLSLAALFVLGFGDMLSVYVRQYLVQSGTPDAVRGRVSAVSAVCIGASNELGEFESGIAAGWLGLVPSLIAGGAATLAITVAWMFLFPVLRKMDRFPDALDRKT
jgi:MFS family permease